MDHALQIQICDLDSYQHVATPLDQLHGLAVKVPFVRVYGALKVEAASYLAYNVLLHVHNYYPYVYIDCPARPLDEAYLAGLKDHFNRKIHDSFQRKPVEDDDFDSDIEDEPTLNFVAAVEYCRGSPVYGYHLGYKQVLKVLLLLPLYKTRLVKLITSQKIDVWNFDGKLKSTHGTPNLYEAHIPYTSQFLADFNLYGCGYLNVKKCHFRLPLVRPSSLDLLPLKEYLLDFITKGNVLNSKRYPRIGRCILELDISAGDILNRTNLVERTNHNDLSEFNNTSSGERIYLSSLKFTFQDLKYQCAIRNMDDTSQLLHSLYSQVFPNIYQDGFQEWETTARFRELIAYVAKLNAVTKFNDPNDYYDHIIKPALPKSVPTSFESVDRDAEPDRFQKLPLLNYRDDLVQWTTYDSLFTAEDSELPADTPRPSTTANIEHQNGGSDHGSLSASQTPQPLDLEILSPDLLMEISKESQSNFVRSNMDAKLTQRKRPFSQVDSSESNSLHSTLTQTLHCIVRNPMCLYELSIPSFLKKSSFKKTLNQSGLMDIEYSDPSYYKKEDVHQKPLIFANKKIIVPYVGDDSLPLYEFGGLGCGVREVEETLKSDITASKPQHWQYKIEPPSKKYVRDWIGKIEKNIQFKKERFRSQIEPAVTQTYDFKYSYRSNKVARNPSGFLNMTNFHMELHANADSQKRPDPKTDAVRAIFYHFDDANTMHHGDSDTTAVFICLEGLDFFIFLKLFKKVEEVLKIPIKIFTSEKEMIASFLESFDGFDPDILSGYEINAASWGYLAERVFETYETNLLARLSRSTFKSNGKFGDRWGYTHTSALKINGRHLLNIWRVLRSELSLTAYSLENVCFHLLHQTLPRILIFNLSKWFLSGNFNKTLMFCKYYLHRLGLTLKIMNVQEIILRNVEQSRLIGVDFNSNFYRGSQFKVESILLRIAKEENMLLNSPSKNQVHDMRALDSIPLIMEPESNFYKSPLVVLDFQSLYPSIMIAYNYCYSTLLGPIEGFQQKKNPVGYLHHFDIPLGIVDILLKNNGINVSPNGMMFVSTKFRKSILSRMLQEILNMRINVKAVSGAFREDVELAKLYNSKQLALKLIANVTYGYTSASFSGRMPNSDIADAIVSTGREILNKSIEIIESSPFQAKVVYGDTDSLFVYFPGRSKDMAFQHGKQLAKEVSDFFPDPIKLKFEKVYHPCVLLAKKRYVGHCFEFEDQVVPKFEAKGIETIRRDGIPAQLKMVGKTLRILFETKDLSKVKLYTMEQFQKIFFNKVNVKDFCFAKEVRYGSYKNEQYLPPGAIIAQKNASRDHRSEPQYRERIPYLVIRDSRKERIKDRAVSPDEYVASYSTDNPLELDFEYYITRVLIPPLERIFNLMGVNIQEWYRDMPKSTRQLAIKRRDITKIGDFVQTEQCYLCEGSLKESSSRYLCRFCLGHELSLVTDVISIVKQKEAQKMDYESICVACNKRNFDNTSSIEYVPYCSNGDCEIYYGRVKTSREFDNLLAGSDRVLEELQLQW